MTVHSLRAFFNRRFPIWEGHVRKALGKLADTIEKHENNAIRIAKATLDFTDAVCTGFSASAFGAELLAEIERGCTPPRKGKPAALQNLGKLLLADPNHRGAAKFLRRLAEEVKGNPQFKGVRIDYPREFWDAVSLGKFADVQDGLSEIARRRRVSPSAAPHQAISTVHKAKGLEHNSVIVVPCDANHFPDTPKGRRLLYVALSRPTHRLMLVLPTVNSTPLLSR